MGAVERRKKRRSLAKRTKSLKGKILALEKLGVYAAYHISDPESGEQWTHNLDQIPLIHDWPSEQSAPSPQSANNSSVEQTEGIAQKHADDVEMCALDEPSLTDSDSRGDVVECDQLKLSATTPTPSWKVLVRCFATIHCSTEPSAQPSWT